MAYADTLSPRDLRRLARQGQAMEAAFRYFGRAGFPAAGPAELQTIRAAFFAGAAELWAMNEHGLDDRSATPTDDDVAFIRALVTEVQRRAAAGSPG